MSQFKASFKIDRKTWKDFLKKARLELNSDASKLLRKFVDETLKGEKP